MSAPSSSARRKRRKQRQTLILSTLAVVLGLLIVRQAMHRGPSEATAQPLQSGGDTTDTGRRSVSEVVEVDAPGAARRDLFDVEGALPQLAAQSETPISDPKPDIETLRRQLRETLRLEAVVLSDKPTVVINGETRHLGDRIAGWTLDAIGRRSVRLVRDGRQVILAFEER